MRAFVRAFVAGGIAGALALAVVHHARTMPLSTTVALTPSTTPTTTTTTTTTPEPSTSTTALTPSALTTATKPTAACPLAAVDAAWMRVTPKDAAELPHTPKSLEPRVHVWQRVWGELSDKTTLIVDERRPWVVFAEINCDDLFAFGDPGFARDRCGERVTGARKNAVAEWKKHWAKPANLRRYAGNRKLAKTAWQNIVGVKGRHDALERAKARAKDQLAHAEGLYEAEGVPRLYARAAIVESLWRPEALSRTGAAGVLQFMPVTSKKYLFVDEGVVDERLDPLRSSWAAARYLADMHKQLKAWPLTLTAYNTGPARMKRVMKIRKSADLGQIANAGDVGEYGFDGQNYYAQIVAIARITKDDVFPEHPPTGRTLQLTAPRDLKTLAACTDTSIDVLAAANPALLAPIRAGEAPVPRGYVLHVPSAGTKTAALDPTTAATTTLTQTR